MATTLTVSKTPPFPTFEVPRPKFQLAKDQNEIEHFEIIQEEDLKGRAFNYGPI